MWLQTLLRMGGGLETQGEKRSGCRRAEAGSPNHLGNIMKASKRRQG